MPAKAKVCKGRRSVHNVMSNSGFGDLTIIRDGVTIHIPQKLLNKTTEKAIGVKLQKEINAITKENAVKLEKKGVRIEVGY